MANTPTSPTATAEPVCLTCGNALERITYPGGYLNRDQWESVRAGDWWCETCPSNGRGRSGAYFWNSEVLPDPAFCSSVPESVEPAPFTPEPVLVPRHIVLEFCRLGCQIAGAEDGDPLDWNKLIAAIDRLRARSSFETLEAVPDLAAFRDDVLHGRGPLAENGMTSEQVNDVLRLFDSHFAEPSASHSSASLPSSIPAPAERIKGFRDGYARALNVSTGTNPRSWVEGNAEIELEAKRYAETVLAPKDSETPEATPTINPENGVLRG